MGLVNSWNSYYQSITGEYSVVRCICFLIITFLLIFLMFFAQIVLHESGHLLFGLLTGHGFHSFRIMNKTLIRKEGRFQIRNYSCQGSLGQCCMTPPQGDTHPNLLYMMGGVLSNFISAILVIPFIFTVLNLPFQIREAFLLFSFYGFGFAMMNGIPMNLNISNDGAEFVHMLHHPECNNRYWKQILISELLIDGFTYRDMPSDLFRFETGENLNHSITGYSKILEYYYFVDKREWGLAAGCLDEFIPGWDDLIPMLKNIVLMEKTFLSIVFHKPLKEIDYFYHQIRPMMEKKSLDIHMVRVKTAYKLEHIKLLSKSKLSGLENISNHMGSSIEFQMADNDCLFDKMKIDKQKKASVKLRDKTRNNTRNQIKYVESTGKTQLSDRKYSSNKTDRTDKNIILTEFNKIKKNYLYQGEVLFSEALLDELFGLKTEIK